MTELAINQQVIIIKDKRNPDDIEYSKYGKYMLDKCIARYEGEFPWAVKFYNGTEWTPGIYDWEEFISGELCNINDVPMKSIYTYIKEENDGIPSGIPFAYPVYKRRFACGRTKLWENEIEYKVIDCDMPLKVIPICKEKDI